MKIIDLHNDGYAPKGVTYLKSVYTTELENPIAEIKRARDKVEFLHIEDAWFINESNVEDVIALKPFSIGLTWNHDNNLAGGAFGEGELTDLGRSIIKKLCSAGIVIDTAHLNRTSFYQVADVVRQSGGRIFCTHTCFADVHEHPRNLDGKQIQTIIDMGGIVGLTLVGEFLGGDIYNHIRYFIDKFGEDNLAIGTDFNGTNDLPHGIWGYEDFPSFRWELGNKGLDDEILNKIFYGNASRFFDNRP